MLNPVGCYDRALSRLSRRELLRVAWLLGIGAIARPAEARRLQGTAHFSTYPFTLGVASGDPLPDGVVLWTRLAPRPLEGGGMPMVPVPVQWELARDSRLPHGRAEGRSAGAAGARAQRPRRGQRASSRAREYWYRFRAGNEISQVGRTKTAPRQAPRWISFGLACAGAATTRPAISPATVASRRSSSTS